MSTVQTPTIGTIDRGTSRYRLAVGRRNMATSQAEVALAVWKDGVRTVARATSASTALASVATSWTGEVVSVPNFTKASSWMLSYNSILTGLSQLDITNCRIFCQCRMLNTSKWCSTTTIIIRQDLRPSIRLRTGLLDTTQTLATVIIRRVDAILLQEPASIHTGYHCTPMILSFPSTFPILRTAAATLVAKSVI